MQSRQQREAEKALHDQTDLLPRGKLLTVLAAISLTLLVTFIDQNGIGVTLPTIAADLEAHDTISWAGTSSLIANTVFQMLYGRLSDIFGRRIVFLTAVALLSLAALLCGLSRGPATFYVFRGLAGIGGGGISNLAMIIVSDIVTLEQRGQYQGVIGAMVGLGNVAGPFLAAAFIANTGSWRGFFYMVSPLAALIGAVAFAMLPSKPPSVGVRESLKKIDFAGVLLSSTAVIFLLIPISGGGAYFPWDSPMVISMLVIGVVALGAFVLVEWRVAKLPMMPGYTCVVGLLTLCCTPVRVRRAVQIFHNRCVTTLLIQSFLFGSVYQSYLYYLPMYLQNARGFSVLESAGFTAITVAIQAVASVCSDQYMSWTQRYGEVIWSGFGLWTLGCGLTLLYTRSSSRGIIALPLVLNGLGVGCIFQPTLVALQCHVPRGRRAVIISNRNFFRCAGGAVGLAVSASVLQAGLRASLPRGFASLAGSTYAVPSREALLELAGGDAGAVEQVLDAYMAASRWVFILQVPLMGLCLLGCFLVRDRGMGPHEGEPVERVTGEQLPPTGDGGGGETGKLGVGAVARRDSERTQDGAEGGHTELELVEAGHGSVAVRNSAKAEQVETKSEEGKTQMASVQ
ncbi:major facilitator superfamily domain-containing protein [Microdochium trichocladiopsis]|uniref:Major facilitator superfamily domain-containing protein n=1 Tax=Microdochium trichocladiopsis TaxID=1682393 RepID=A0A9P9BSM2_9PEZI|nr:major facilitator superfamily domain-containing protein [Microdochium trichocladiopsis]KAH7038050.1 major facilitator superfamily domain-containing protein [Microdochium trichocladiopsis]